MIDYIDVVQCLRYGDSGKGCVSYDLARSYEFSHVMRFHGGGNAGHTIMHKGNKFVTHLIPAGVFHGKPSIVGSGCVINVNKFFEEMEKLRVFLPEHDVYSLVKIANNCHIVTEENIKQDAEDKTIGTTKSGNGPCYRDKYDRKGVRAEDVPSLHNFIIDPYRYFYDTNNKIQLLCEGAQGFYLDIDHGDYPYVTSSHCGIGSVLLNGFNPKQIRNVYGLVKAYDTYVGAKKFQPTYNDGCSVDSWERGDPKIFEDIQRVGQEIGATTGRKRQVNWLDLEETKKAILMNGVNILVVKKYDVLVELDKFGLITENGVVRYETFEDFKEQIENYFSPYVEEIIFSNNPAGL